MMEMPGSTTYSKYHKLLERQIHQHLESAQEIMPFVQPLLEAINASYYHFERDRELFQQSLSMNDKEYNRITQSLQNELNEKSKFQRLLTESILRLDNETNLDAGDSGNVLRLLDILNYHIARTKFIESELVEAKLSAERASYAKTDFLSMMSHEIRTPLNAIIGLMYIMENEDTLGSYRENFPTLKLSANNLNSLINDILDFNKIESGKLDLETIDFSLQQLLTDTQKTLSARALENGSVIELELDKECPARVYGDPLRLGQVMNNLVSNACKFTQNGFIKIKCATVKINETSYTCKISVQDTGIGIAPDKFELIFQKFSQADSQTTRKYGGSGLGLVITERILKLYNSKIDLQSKLNQGSTFSFLLTLPIANGPLSDSLLKTLDTKIVEEDLQGMRVLLVEDNPFNITVGKKILERWNVVVDVAENGKIAVEKCQQNHYDVVLMDIHMPEMDGYTATIKIREQENPVPIIALTASASLLSINKAKTLGMNDFLTKPFNPQILHDKLLKLITQKTEFNN